MSITSNAQINGTIVLDSSAFDINVSTQSGNSLVKKDDGYYVPTVKTGTVEIDLISTLKLTEPKDILTSVYVKSANSIMVAGGGTFYFDSTDTKTADDGGMCIVTASGKRWKRVMDNVNNLNVTHFGAIPDGVTDCSAACMAMYKWSVKYNARIGIQFPAGNFKLNSFDISDTQTGVFRMVGAMVSYGYFPATNLVSDNGTGMMIKVQARWAEVANFIVDGENDVTPNTKAFFQNTVVSGQYIRVSNIRWKNMGGCCLTIQDTLDTKIDQFYASNCSGGVILNTWSGAVTGSWDHTTACELSNFNVQNCKSDVQVFDMQRCTQSFIYNGWIEKTTNPGDLSNGGWIIDGLSMEDCLNPLNLTYCKYIMKQKNFQGTSAITTTDSTKTRWLSIYEDGHTEMMHYGFRSTGSMNYGFVTSENRFSNNATTSGWIKLGDLFVPSDGDTVNIKIVGSLGFSSVANSHTVASGRHGGGEALLRCQKKSSGVQLTWEGSGSCPVQDVMYVMAANKTNCAIYVKLGPYVMNCIALVETTSKDRFYAGVCFRWTFDGTKMIEADVKALEGVRQALGQASWNAGSYGIAIGSDGYIGLSTVAVVDGKLQIYLNDVLYSIPVTKV